MERFKQKLQQAGIPFRENEPLAAHCTFKIGGPADVFVQPETEEQEGGDGEGGEAEPDKAEEGGTEQPEPSPAP